MAYRYNMPATTTHTDRRDTPASPCNSSRVRLRPESLWSIFYEWHGDNNSQSSFKIILDSIIRPANPSVSFAADLKYGSVSSSTKTV
jgi:hypothetical protein